MQGCSFSQQTRNVSPYFDGVLKMSGLPLENTQILLSTKEKDNLCFKPVQTARTDSDGRFSVQPVKENYRYIPFMNYEFKQWTLCAIHKDQRYTLYSNNSYSTQQHINESIILDCDLSNPLDRVCRPRL
jgi:5-hydroxyisourate hydrolase-like protein (transthyretin family)